MRVIWTSVIIYLRFSFCVSSQVCEEHAASLHILPMAINYLDRVLSCSRMREDELELTAMACVLIASKLNNSEGLPVEKLGHHHLFNARQLLVSAELKWGCWQSGFLPSYDYQEAAQLQKKAQSIDMLGISLSPASRYPDLIIELVLWPMIVPFWPAWNLVAGIWSVGIPGCRGVEERS